MITKYLKNHPITRIILNNQLLIVSFLISILCYTVYVAFRGFGWDGDSLLSAAQYHTLVGSDLYGLIEGGAHPKILSILLFGIIYKLSGGFYVLTIVAMLLNATMIAVIAQWINKEKGIWLLAIIGLLINIPWTKIVINCDNPAFSIPFIVFGLYYISKDKFVIGATFLMFSSLFRSGAEFILIFILIKQLINTNHRNTIILGLAFIISCIHTYWGYLLVYQTKELFWESTWGQLRSSEYISEYQYSLNAFMAYLTSVVRQLFYKYYIWFLIPSIIGLIRIIRKQNSIKFLLLTPLASLISPIGAFIYGTYHDCYETKHMGYTLLLPILAAFAIDSLIFRKISYKAKVVLTSGILLLVLLLSAFTGTLKKGDYDAHINGTGTTGWISFPSIKQDIISLSPSEKINILTAYKYLTFVILDLGEFAKNIDFILTATEFDYTTSNKYDIIIIRKNRALDPIKMLNLGFIIKSNIDDPFVYYFSTIKFPSS